MKRCRVLIVDDYLLVRHGLRAILAAAPGVQIVGEAETASSAVEQARLLNPDVVLLDQRLPDTSGPEVIQAVKAAAPDAAVVILAPFANAGEMLEAIQSGANACVSKECRPEELLHALQAVCRGEAYLEPLMAQCLFTAVRESGAQFIAGTAAAAAAPATKAVPSILTEREAEVFKLVATNHRNKEIAQKLYISENTVKTHVSNILKKLGLSDRSQLIWYGARSGLNWSQYAAPAASTAGD